MWWFLHWKHEKCKTIEQHFQDAAQNIVQDKNSDSFDAHFTKKCTQKPIPQQL